MPETVSLCYGSQTQPDEMENNNITAIDESFIHDEILSQELLDLKLQMEDYDND